MDDEDRKDIIKKINTAGNDDNNKDTKNDDSDNQNDTSNDSGDDSDFDFGDSGDDSADTSDNEKDLQELSVYENLFLEEPKRNNMWQEGSNDILDEEGGCWPKHERVQGTKKGEKGSCRKIEVNEGEGEAPTRYMFFSNLEQMRRQAGLMLDLDEEQIESILNGGHDWAADHIAEAKNNMDQVFDFLMNEIKGDGVEGHQDEYAEWSKPMEIQQDIPVSDELAYHLQNEIALGESVFRYGSDKFFSLLNEVKTLYTKGLIKLNENDTFIVNDFDLGYLQVGDDKIKMNFIFEEIDSEVLNEAEYQGKDVEIGKPKRGGSKKFYVYVRNPKTKKIKKVSFGAKSGGGKLSVKLKDPKARKAFADRHNCEQKNDKTKPGYWACRLPRYAKLLGLSGGGRWW